MRAEAQMSQETLESGTEKHRNPKKLHEDSVISILETAVLDGKNYDTKFYRLKAILAVGLHCHSQRNKAKRNAVKDLFCF